ncbi:MAG: hypothetical protein NZM25_00090 [Leptospiraceae bacterium]|nr:hypothetical protein [Leptospiraceae bacterium]MDW8307560.1 hypothetical protein [Leptospiraceae bacterium]
MLRRQARVIISVVYFSGEILFGVEIHAFRSYTSPYHEKMKLIGEVLTRSHLMGERQKILGFDTRQMIFHARLFADYPLRIGDLVYVVQKDPDHRKYREALIVAQGEVIAVYQTGFQGKMITAKGNLSMVRPQQFIAVSDIRKKRFDALVHYKAGERYERLGEEGVAYAYYRKSLELDEERPETHLRLAEKAWQSRRISEAERHIQEAWENRRHFERALDYLKAGTLYTEIKLALFEERAKTKADLLKSLISLKEDHHQFRKGFIYFGDSFADKDDSSIAIRDAHYHYYQALLYEKLYDILATEPLTRLLSWLEKKEREILYSAMLLPRREKKVADPRETWEEAYLQAALAHYETAHELNPLETQAAYRLVELAARILAQKPPQAKREIYEAMLEYYADEFLRIPSSKMLSLRVRHLKNTLLQD